MSNLHLKRYTALSYLMQALSRREIQSPAVAVIDDGSIYYDNNLKELYPKYDVVPGINNWRTAEFFDDFLKFTILSNGVITYKTSDAEWEPELSYSLDDGDTWIDITPTTSGVSISVETGDELLFKGTNAQYGYSDSKYVSFGGTATFNASGNIMAIIDALNYKKIASFTNDYVFYSLFKEATNLISVEGLKLLPKTITAHAYSNMFYGCTNLIDSPVLAARNLGEFCYYGMFQGCSSLEVAPLLPATNLANSCYYNMFFGTGLISMPDLPATTLADSCYMHMFGDCTNLINVTNLPATTLPNCCYQGMFTGCTSLTSAPVISAVIADTYACFSMFSGCTSLLTAPSLLVTNGNYAWASEMFKGCTGLLTAPTSLPAVSLTTSCYESMFEGCTSLTVAPSLPATTLAEGCYAFMFYGCSGLVTPPATLPAISLESGCYTGMFKGCSSLTTIPTISATGLASISIVVGYYYNDIEGGCFESMFEGCSSLTTTPSLPYTTLTSACYRNMFKDCTALTTTPSLPATTLAVKCYENMFYGCTHITSAPILAATTLVEDCYSGMFYGCSLIDHIICYALNDPSYLDGNNEQVTLLNSNWLTGTAASGLFELDYNTLWDATDKATYIPSGWTIDNDYHKPYSEQYFTVEITSNGNFTVLPLRENYSTAFTAANALSISYSLNKETWITTELLDAGLTLNVTAGDKIRFKGTNTNYCYNSGSNPHKQWYVIFGYTTTDLPLKNTGVTITTADYNVYGNIMSLCYGDNFIGQTTLLADYTFCQLFKSANITSAENLILPAMTLRESCYRAMFSKALKLTISPTFIATALVSQCYKYMFESCGSLTKITCLAESNMTTSNTLQSFTGQASGLPSVPATGLFIKSPNVSYSGSGSSTEWSRGVNGIPSGWTVQDYSAAA